MRLSISRRFAPLLSLIGLLAAVAAVFQNCGQEFAPLDMQAVKKEDIERDALSLLQNRCAQCHSSESHAAPKAITDKDRLIFESYIIPGDPDMSPLYTSLFANMPLGGPPLGENEKALIRRWIEDLGSANPTPEPSSTPNPSASPTASPTAGPSPTPTPSPTPAFATYSQVRAIINACNGCHGGSSGLNQWGTTHAQLLAFKSNASFATPAITPGNADQSRFVIRITGNSALGSKMGNLSSSEIAVIRSWISGGALPDPTPSPSPSASPSASPSPTATPPPPPARMVYFESDIKPIMNRACVSCHNALGSYGTTLTFRECLPGLSAAVCVNAGMPQRPGSSIISGQASSSRFLIRVAGDSAHGARMGSLTAAEVQLVRDWINQGAKASPGGINQAFKISLGDRHYVASVLRTVYSRPGVTMPSVQATAIQNINQRADLFGGPCHIQDLVRTNAANQIDPRSPRLTESLANFAMCHSANTEEARLNASLTPESSTVSESFRMSACLSLTSNRTTMSAALANAGLEESSDINAENVRKMYRLFYPGSEMGDLVRDSLLRIGTKAEMTPAISAESGLTRRYEGWRFINLALCLSPAWMAP